MTETVEALASDIIDKARFEKLAAFVEAEFPTAEDKVMSLFCMRALCAKLEYFTGIPHFEAVYDPEDEE